MNASLPNQTPSFFGETAAIRCERAAAELRAGRPVVVNDQHRRLATLALDSTSPAGFSAFAAAADGRHYLFLTAPRARTLGVESTFGIDYRHQAAATAEIPAAMRAKLRAELPKVVGAEALRDVLVLFARANDSSLDYVVWADLAGAAAPLANRIPGEIQRLLVEACNENGWTIPFPQLTVHQ